MDEKGVRRKEGGRRREGGRRKEGGKGREQIRVFPTSTKRRVQAVSTR